MTCPLEPWSVRYRRMTGAGVSEGSASLGATKASRKAKTQLSYESVLRTRVLPRWGSVRLADISHADVIRWQSELASEVGPSLTRLALAVLSQGAGRVP